MASQKTPAVILTGFLGAGKTTLLNRILTADHGRRIAVIVNEFGEVGIDHDLLISSDQQIVQMNNGCICCTVRGDLLRSLFELLEHKDDFDTLVIETTGLAEPAPVAQTFMVDERIRSEFALSGVVTLVDAMHVRGQLEHSVEAREQIAFADLILLNKTDLATPEELDSIETDLRHLNRIATVVRTKQSELDVASLFDIGAADLEQRLDRARPSHGHAHHHHTDDIETVCIVEPEPLDGLRLSQWFRNVITQYGANILRMKGILNLRGDPDRFIFQGVHMMFEGKPGPRWRDGEERVNRLVFIGRGLDEEAIVQGFKECLRGPADASLAGDPFGRRYVEISPFTLDQIRFWMKQIFQFPGDSPIVIKEVPCVKPGCPPIETAIMVVLKHEPPRLFKIQQTINEVNFDHVYNLIENPMPCC